MIGVTSNCDRRHLGKYMDPGGLRAHSPGVAVAAIDLGHVAEIDGMLEAELLGDGLRHAAFFLTENGVTGVAFLGDDFALGADMLSIVTAEASVEVEVPDVVGMSLPVQLHFRKRGPAEDVLQFVDGVANLQGFGSGKLGILVGVEVVNVLGDSLHRGVSGVVFRGQGGDGLLLDEGEASVDTARQQGLIHGQVRRDVDVGRPIVAVHTIHAAGLRPGNLVLTQGGIFCEILRNSSLHVFDVNVGDDLMFFVGGNVGDFVAYVHVPVNAFWGAGGGVAASGLDQEADLAQRIVFIAGIVGKHFELGTIEFFRPVALLAGLLRRAQIVDGSGDGARISFEGSGKNLPCSGQLGFHVPRGAGADVALHAGNAGVRRELIGSVFRSHHGVTELTAELDGVSELIGFVTADGAHHDKDTEKAQKKCSRAALAGIIQINLGIKRGAFGTGRFPALFSPIANQNEQQTRDQESGHHHESENADVRAGPFGDEIDQEEKKDVGQRNQRHGDTRHAYRITW